MSASRFPQRIKRGSCIVTIYRTPTKGCAAYTLVYYDGAGTRWRRMFTDHAAARLAAEEVADSLAAGKPELQRS